MFVFKLYIHIYEKFYIYIYENIYENMKIYIRTTFSLVGTNQNGEEEIRHLGLT